MLYTLSAVGQLYLNETEKKELYSGKKERWLKVQNKNGFH